MNEIFIIGFKAENRLKTRYFVKLITCKFIEIYQSSLIHIKSH